MCFGVSAGVKTKERVKAKGWKIVSLSYSVQMISDFGEGLNLLVGGLGRPDEKS